MAPHQRPDESGQFPRDGDRSDLAGLAAPDEPREAPAQAPLSLSGLLAHDLGPPLGALAEVAGLPGPVAVVPGGLDPRAPGVALPHLVME